MAKHEARATMEEDWIAHELTLIARDDKDAFRRVIIRLLRLSTKARD